MLGRHLHLRRSLNSWWQMPFMCMEQDLSRVGVLSSQINSGEQLSATNCDKASLSFSVQKSLLTSCLLLQAKKLFKLLTKCFQNYYMTWINSMYCKIRICCLSVFDQRTCIAFNQICAMVFTPWEMGLGHNISVLSMHCMNILSTIYCRSFNIISLHFSAQRKYA